MRCKVGDRVLVINGPAIGAVGTIIGPATTRLGASDWLVEFPRPVRCYVMLNGKAAMDRRSNSPDSYLWPIPDAPEQIDNISDIEVVA